MILPQDCSAEAYARQLAQKEAALAALLGPFDAPAPSVHPSPFVHYRQRAEFRVWHEGDDLHYLMFDGRTPVRVERFLPGAERIDALMPALRERLVGNPVLRRKLYQVEFLTTLAGEALLTLIYHRPLDAGWEGAARTLARDLDVRIIGRARRQRVVLDEDFVNERLAIHGQVLEYRQPEGCFTQPNAAVNTAMIDWSRQACADGAGEDLVELYCGIGNFTVALAPLHRQVLATEIDSTATAAAGHNLAANGVSNTFLARLSSAEASAALARERPFRRLKGFDLDDFRPRSLLVDPPRAGLDARTLDFARGFERIVYISCNPHTLCGNLQALGRDWRIERSALFDQFPYTPHMECGVLLQRHR